MGGEYSGTVSVNPKEPSPRLKTEQIKRRCGILIEAAAPKTRRQGTASFALRDERNGPLSLY